MVAGRTSEPRSVTLTTTSASAAVTAAAGTFSKRDVGRVVTATGINAGTTLSAVASDTAATLSANASATGSRSATIGATTTPINEGIAYGFVGWSPESDAESQTYTVTALGTSEPSRITNPNTPVGQRGRG